MNLIDFARNYDEFLMSQKEALQGMETSISSFLADAMGKAANAFLPRILVSLLSDQHREMLGIEREWACLKVGQFVLRIHLNNLSWECSGEGVSGVNWDKVHDEISGNREYAREIVNFAQVVGREGGVDLIEYIEKKAAVITALLNAAIPVLEELQLRVREYKR